MAAYGIKLCWRLSDGLEASPINPEKTHHIYTRERKRESSLGEMCQFSAIIDPVRRWKELIHEKHRLEIVYSMKKSRLLNGVLIFCLLSSSDRRARSAPQQNRMEKARELYKNRYLPIRDVRKNTPMKACLVALQQIGKFGRSTPHAPSGGLNSRLPTTNLII